MAIDSVTEFINAVKDGTIPNPPMPAVVPDDLNDEVYWGSAGSLDAGDAGSRLGLDMGEPSIKAAHVRELLVTKEAAVLAGLARGGAQLAKTVASKMKGPAKNVWDYGVTRRQGAAAARTGAAPRTIEGEAFTGQQLGWTSPFKGRVGGPGKVFDAMEVPAYTAAVTSPAWAWAAPQSPRTLGGYG